MTATQSLPSACLLKTRIKGSVIDVTHIKLNEKQGFFRNFVTVPADNEYTHASTFIVHASTPLGQDGQEVDVTCLVRSASLPECYNIQLWLEEFSDA